MVKSHDRTKLIEKNMVRKPTFDVNCSAIVLVFSTIYSQE